MAKQRKAAKRKGSRNRPIPVINPNAAGIDVGAREVYVAAPQDRDPEPVRTFATFTPDLVELANWLAVCGVTTVAMEATSVYWMPLFTILEERGIEVCLVNARHLRRVPGRKTDVLDCEWLQYLHSVGLLRGSFHPSEAVAAVRTVLRHKASLVQMGSSHVQHMHKALTQMNLQIHHVISDITGVTGMAILDAILAGEKITPPKEIDLQYAVASALVGRAIRAKGSDEADNTYTNILKYASTFRHKEMGVMLVSDMHRAIGEDLFAVEEFANWADAIADIMLYG